MVEPWRAALEDRTDHDQAGLARDLGQCLGGRARDRLGQVESRGVLELTKIPGAEQFRQAGDLRITVRRLAEHRTSTTEVVPWVVGASHLDQAHGERVAHGEYLSS